MPWTPIVDFFRRIVTDSPDPTGHALAVLTIIGAVFGAAAVVTFSIVGFFKSR